MPHPKHRRTSSDKKKRAAHFGLKKINAKTCEKCGESVLPHHACNKCGFYNGRQVIETDKQTERLLKKAQAKAAASQPEKAPEKEEKAEKVADKKPKAKKKTEK